MNSWLVKAIFFWFLVFFFNYVLVDIEFKDGSFFLLCFHFDDS